MPTPTITVKIAPTFGRTQGERSSAGHVWIVVDNGNGIKTSMGFGPQTPGEMFDQGATRSTDDGHYIDVAFEQTAILTQQQYDDLMSFNQNPNSHGFNPTSYDAFSNSCVDYVMKALEIIGLNPDGFEGDPYPTNNDEIILGMLGLQNTLIMSPWTQDVLNSFETAKNTASPLVLDLDGDGIELVAMSAAGAVYWDLDNDDMAEASGWITGGDGLLCIDLNSDGIIDNQAELFGNTSTYANGFLALAAYDSNTSGTITSADTQFGDLLVWIDANADGYSQSGELHSLSSLSITSINLGYSNVNYAIAGNDILQESTFTINGNTRAIVDVWFAYDNVNTKYVGDYDLDVRVLTMPSLRGYGNLPDLHIAMSLDEGLLDMVAEIAEEDAATLFSAAFDLKGKMADIMYRWAGVDGVSSTSRGAYIDARQLEFLEEFADEEWVGDIGANPGAAQANILKAAFENTLNHFTTRILAQVSSTTFLFPETSYDIINDTFVDSDTIKVQFGGAGGDYLSGNGDINILVALQGHDDLVGGANNDILIGGENTDNLYGGTGDDTYIFSNGFTTGYGPDEIYEYSSEGTDTVSFIDNINPEDVYIWSDTGQMIFQLVSDTSSQLYLKGSYNGTTGLQVHTERLIFADGTVWDLTEGFKLNDSNSAHYLYGSAGNDEMNGNGGNDYLYGYTGDDTLYGGSGTDNLYGNDGNDILEGGANSDNLYGGANSDTFMYKAATAFGTGYDFIYDFSLAQNDKFDISDVLEGFYDPITDVITDFVQITSDGSNSHLKIDQDGTANGTNFVEVAYIVGVATGLTDEAALVTSGNLIVS